MSIRVSRTVWKHFRDGGNLKLVMLAFADWADDQGGTIYPSMETIATKVCCSKSQAKRTVHSLIKRGFVVVIGNENGGKAGTTRHYRIALERLTGSTDAPRSANATGSADATPTGSTDATRDKEGRVAPMHPDGVQIRTETGSTHAPLTVIEQPLVISEGRTRASKPATKRKPKHLPLTPCPDDIEVTDHMSLWAISKGVPEDRVMDETEKFLNHYIGKGTLNYDWVATWRNWMLKAVEFAQPGQSVRQQSAMKAV